MNTDQAYADRLKAQLRAADARLDELEASARASSAEADMDRITTLRAQRDRVRQRLDDARQQSSGSSQDALSVAKDDFRAFRRSIADAQSDNAWDQAREQRYNAHLDEVDAALRRSSAQDAEVAADVRVAIAESRDNLKARLLTARQNFDAWRQRREDKAAIRSLNAAELELDDAFDDFAFAVQRVVARGTERAD
jgi:hypothetical protein